MIPGIWTSYFMELSIEEAIPIFAENGWRSLEFSDEHGAALLQRGAPEKIGGQVRQFAAEHGVRFPQGHLKLAINIGAEESDWIISELKRWLDLFVSLGIRAGVLHPGWRENAPDETVMESRVRVLRALSDHLGEADFTICLENMVAHEAADLIAIIQAAGCDHLGICLDTGHLNQHSPGQGQARFIGETKDYLKAMHLAENDGTADQHMMPFARGCVPWHEVMETLKEVGYEGLLNLEVPGERSAPPEVKKLKLAYMREMMDLVLRIDNRRPKL